MGEKYVEETADTKKDTLYELIEIFNMGYSMVVIYDSKGNILGWNQAADKLFQTSNTETQINLMQLIPYVFYEYAGEVWIESSYRNGKKRTILYPEDSVCIPVQIKIYKKQIQDESFGICVMRDLTDMMESKLEKTEFMNGMIDQIQDRTKVLAQITHDLKTPVNGIYGLVHAMKSQERNKEDQENLQLIEECCEHMANMVDQVLVHEKLKNGGNLLKEEYVDMYRVIENSVAVQRFVAKEKGLDIYSNVSGKTPKIIYTDRGKLAEAIGNLLSNAVKFTQIGFVSLNVLCRRTGYNRLKLLFMVSDTGEGIDKDHQEMIFEAFHREYSATKQKQAGTGLGLAIVKQLVQVMHGEIRLDSSPNQGSKFYCTIEAKLDCDDDINPALKKRYPKEDVSMDELIAEMEQDVIPEAEIRMREYILKVKEFGTTENDTEIIRSLDLLKQIIVREEWRAADREVRRLSILIPSTNEKLWNQAFQLELSIRRCNLKGSMLHLEQLEEYFSSE